MFNDDSNDPIVLCIDLDGTLVKTDTFLKTLFIFIRLYPHKIGLILFWWIKGLAYLKQEIAKRVQLNVKRLPYHAAFLNWIRAEKKKGRKLILVSATDQRIARAVAEELTIFDGVWASDGKTNLRSIHKARLLNDQYGEKKYDYAGNEKMDFAVWRCARYAIVVNANASVLSKVKKIATVGRIF